MGSAYRHEIETKNYPLLKIRLDGYFNFGWDTFEWGFYTFGVPVVASFVDRFRMNFRLFEKGDKANLFNNSALSLFAGTSVNRLHALTTGQIYFGASWGTKIQKDETFAIELFSSPSLNFVNYKYNNFNAGPFTIFALMVAYGPPFINETVGQSVEFSVPIAKRMFFRELMGFSGTFGIAPTFVVVQNSLPDIYGGNYGVPDRESYAITEYRFEGSRVRVSFFAQLGLHFGNRKINREIRERRKLEEISNLKREGGFYEN